MSKKCFFISPIGSEGSDSRKLSNNVFRYIIQPICEEKGYDVKRADQITHSGEITPLIIEHVVQSDLVIADLSYHNPNVFYELAIRHSYHKPVIQIVRWGENIPFDVKDMNTILYEPTWDGPQKAAIEIGKRIESIERGEKVSNPVTNVGIDLGFIKLDTLPVHKIESTFSKGSEKEVKQYEQILGRYHQYKNKLLNEAKNGNNESQYILGLNYFLGNISFEQDYKEATKWARLAADDNYSRAQNLMGELYYRGCYVKQDFEKSFEWHKKAADQDIISSCGFIGFMHRIGLGCEQNIEEAIRYYNKGIAAGDVGLNVPLGTLYEWYLKDFSEAENCYKKAVNSAASSDSAYYYLGMLYLYGYDGKRPNHLEAGKYFKKSAEGGKTESKRRLADLFYWGSDFPQDHKQASHWYEQAAENGDSEAQYVLAYLHQYGLDVSQNDQVALKWFEKAAEQGHRFSQRHAGNIYFKQKKYHLAFELFRLAADKGDGPAQRRLGDMYSLGLGCDMDHDEATRYYQLAASCGDLLSQKSLELQSLPLLDI